MRRRNPQFFRAFCWHQLCSCVAAKACICSSIVIPRRIGAAPVGPGSRGFLFLELPMNRVVCLVDGFNLYHALDALRKPWLKWLDLWSLAQRHTRPRSETLEAVYYFSAYAYWLPGPSKRHRAYVRALEARRVTPVMGQFKEKDRHCRKCGARWIAYEEKETDVNIAVALLRLAHKDEFDRCLIVSRDSDLAPAIRALRADFPSKAITVLAPPNRGHSTELLDAADHNKAKITVAQLEDCQLPDKVTDAGGNLVATRPAEYVRKP